MRVTIFHNPSAGHDRWNRQELIRLLKAAGHQPAYFSTEDRASVAEGLRNPGDLVALAGGDGTVRKVAAQLIGSGVSLTVLPLGTANNVAKTLGMEATIEELVTGWPSGWHVPFDVGKVRGPWGESFFLEGAGLGTSVRTMATLTHVQAAPSPDGDPADELTRDLRVYREVLADHREHELRLTLDGRDLSGSYVVLEAMNIRSIGPNIPFAPDADCSDGLIDLALLGAGDRAMLRDYLTARIDGDEARLDLPVHRGRTLEVRWKGSRVHIDDEIWPDEEDAASGKWWPGPDPISLEITVLQRALRFLVPG